MNTSQTDSPFVLSPVQQRFQQSMLNPMKFRMFALFNVPMLFLSGTRIKRLDTEVCATRIPFKWLTKNPFRSIYFAAQSMAAELSTAAPILMATQGYKPSIAFIVVNLEAEFGKKATGATTFTCEDASKAFEAVQKTVETGEAVTVQMTTEGKLDDGTVVSTFRLTWSLKQRGK